MALFTLVGTIRVDYLKGADWVCSEDVPFGINTYTNMLPDQWAVQSGVKSLFVERAFNFAFNELLVEDMHQVRNAKNCIEYLLTCVPTDAMSEIEKYKLAQDALVEELAFFVLLDRALEAVLSTFCKLFAEPQREVQRRVTLRLRDDLPVVTREKTWMFEPRHVVVYDVCPVA